MTNVVTQFNRPIGRSKSLRMCAILLLLACALTQVSNAQILLDSFTDSGPKDDGTFNSSAADDQHFYIAGQSSNSCGPNGFVACIDRSGNQIWTSLDQEIEMGLDIDLQLINGNLIAMSMRDGTAQLRLQKFDMTDGQMEWETILEELPRVMAPFRMQAYPGNQLVVQAYASFESNMNMSWLDLTSGAVERMTTFGVQSLHSDGKFGIDADGDIYILNSDVLIKYDGSNPSVEGIEWQTNYTDLPELESLHELVTGPGNRLFGIDKSNGIHEFNAADGQLIRSIQIIQDVNSTFKFTASHLQWPHLYLYSEGLELDDKTFNIAKVDLNEFTLQWHATRQFTERNFAAQSVELDADGDVIVAGGFYTENFSPLAEIQLLHLDQTNGELNSWAIPQVSPLQLDGMNVRRSAETLMLFSSIPGHVVNNFRSNVRAQVLDQTTGEPGQVTEYQGTYLAPSSVIEFLDYHDGSLQLRQRGTVTELVRLDADFNLLWQTPLPHDATALAGLHMAVNTSDQVGILCRPSNLLASNSAGSPIMFEQFAQRFKLALYVVNSDGSLAAQYREEHTDPIWVAKGLIAIGNDFYASTIGRPLNQTEHFVLRFNADESEFIKQDGRYAFEGISAQLFIQGDNVFALGSADKSKASALLFELNKEFGILAPLGLFDNIAEIDNLRQAISINGGTILVGDWRPNPAEATQSSEILRVDLDAGTVDWRIRIPNYLHTLTLQSDGRGKLFALGIDQSANLTDFNLILRCINETDGSIEWTQARALDEEARLLPEDMLLLEDQIIICGRQFQETPDGIERGFVLRYDLNGNQLQMEVSENRRNTGLHQTAQGQILLAAQTIFEGDCHWSGAVYLLDEVVSVSERLEHADGQLRIFPNPADGTCFLVFHGVTGQEYTIVVRDLQGRRVLEIQARLQDPDAGLSFDTARLQTGVYSVEVLGDAAKFKAMLLKP